MIVVNPRVLGFTFVSSLLLSCPLVIEGKRLLGNENDAELEDSPRHLVLSMSMSPAPAASPTTGAPSVCTSDPDFLEYCMDSCDEDVCETCDSYRRDRHRRNQMCYTPPPPDPCAGKWKSARAFKHYWCGDGEEVTLVETGLLTDVTDYWKNEKEAEIKSDICGWMKGCRELTDVVGEDWGISRPWPTECHFWIGGFTLTLSKITEKFPCPTGGGHDYTIELSMRDTFEEPLSPIGITCELPGSTVFDVTHTWTLNLHCPDVPCPRGPSCCGGKGQKCCGLDQCNGVLTCIDDICYDIDCGPNECTCIDNWIMECNYQFKWYPHEYCDDYVCAVNQNTGNCYCDPPGYSQSPVAAPHYRQL